jgi:hypothetical protein
MDTKREPPEVDRLLDEEIERVIRSMPSDTIGSQDYAKKVDVLTKLYAMRKNDKTSKLSKDTMATVGANLLGIFMILKHERFHPITSRAMQFVVKAK